MLQQHMASTGRILKTYTNMAQKIPSNFTCDLWSKSLPFAPILSEMHHILDSITFYQVIHGVRSFDMSKLIFRIFLRCELRNCIWYQILENYPIAETQWRKFFVWVFTSNPWVYLNIFHQSESCVFTMLSWSRQVKIRGLKSSIEVQLLTVSGNLKKMLYSCLCTSFVSCYCVLTEKIDEKAAMWPSITFPFAESDYQVGASPIFSGHVRVNQWSDFFGRGPIFSGHRSTWNVWWWFWKLRWAHNTCFSLFLMS